MSSKFTTTDEKTTRLPASLPKALDYSPSSKLQFTVSNPAWNSFVKARGCIGAHFSFVAGCKQARGSYSEIVVEPQVDELVLNDSLSECKEMALRFVIDLKI